MKYCKYCGAELSDKAKFCSECGSTVDVDEAINRVSAQSDFTDEEVDAFVSSEDGYAKAQSIDIDSLEDGDEEFAENYSDEDYPEDYSGEDYPDEEYDGEDDEQYEEDVEDDESYYAEEDSSPELGNTAVFDSRAARGIGSNGHGAYSARQKADNRFEENRPESKKSKKPLIIALSSIGGLLIVGIVLLIILLSRSDDRDALLGKYYCHSFVSNGIELDYTNIYMELLRDDDGVFYDGRPYELDWVVKNKSFIGEVDYIGGDIEMTGSVIDGTIKVIFNDSILTFSKEIPEPFADPNENLTEEVTDEAPEIELGDIDQNTVGYYYIWSAETDDDTLDRIGLIENGSGGSYLNLKRDGSGTLSIVGESTRSILWDEDKILIDSDSVKYKRKGDIITLYLMDDDLSVVKFSRALTSSDDTGMTETETTTTTTATDTTATETTTSSTTETTPTDESEIGYRIGEHLVKYGNYNAFGVDTKGSYGLLKLKKDGQYELETNFDQNSGDTIADTIIFGTYKIEMKFTDYEDGESEIYPVITFYDGSDKLISFGISSNGTTFNDQWHGYAYSGK